MNTISGDKIKPPGHAIIGNRNGAFVSRLDVLDSKIVKAWKQFKSSDIQQAKILATMDLVVQPSYYVSSKAQNKRYRL